MDNQQHKQQQQQEQQKPLKPEEQPQVEKQQRAASHPPDTAIETFTTEEASEGKVAGMNWGKILIISGILIAFLLVCGAIYFHVQQKNHYGRLLYEGRQVEVSGVDAALISTTTEPSPTDAIAHYHWDDVEPTTASSFFSDRELIPPEVINAFKQLTQLLLSIDGPYNATSSSAEKDLSEEYASDELTILESSSLIAASEASGDGDGDEWEARTSIMPPSSSSSSSLSSLSSWSSSSSERHISEACMQCICEAVNGCQQTKCSSGEPCGLYRISVPYWEDAGRPKLEGDYSQPLGSAEADGGHAHCVNNAYCAARTIAAFVNKYARDCNEDGIIDCRDHVALHILGPSGCLRSELLPFHESRMEYCLSKFEASTVL